MTLKGPIQGSKLFWGLTFYDDHTIRAYITMRRWCKVIYLVVQSLYLWIDLGVLERSETGHSHFKGACQGADTYMLHVLLNTPTNYLSRKVLCWLRGWGWGRLHTWGGGTSFNSLSYWGGGEAAYLHTWGEEGSVSIVFLASIGVFKKTYCHVQPNTNYTYIDMTFFSLITIMMIIFTVLYCRTYNFSPTYNPAFLTQLNTSMESDLITPS